MSDQQGGNPYLSTAVNFITNPWVMAGLGGAAGYYFFGRKDGKTIEGKRPYIAAGVGAATGLAAGKLIQHLRENQAQLPSQQAVPQMTEQQVQEQAQAQADQANYYDMDSVEGGDVDSAFGQPPMGQPGVSQGEQGVPLQAEMDEPMGLGSLDGTSLGGSEGLGSFAREIGMDAYDESVDEAIDEVRRRGEAN